MQKKAIITSLTLLCLLFISFSAFAQTRIIEIDNDGVDPVIYEMDSNYDVTFKTPTVKVANLEPINRSASGTLPPGTLPIFLKMEVLGTVTMIPVTTFEFSNYVNGYPVYKMTPTEVTVNFEGLCPSNPSGPFMFSRQYSLVTADESPYPIHNPQYSNPNGIFSCQVFYLTSGDCIPKGKDDGPLVIPSLNYPVSSFWGGVNCPIHYRPSFGSPTISPNPFDQSLQLDYQLEKEEVIEVSIFNGQGKLMTQSKKLQSADRHQTTFDTSQWPNGIYYCRLQGVNTNKVMRVLKAR